MPSNDAMRVALLKQTPFSGWSASGDRPGFLPYSAERFNDEAAELVYSDRLSTRKWLGVISRIVARVSPALRGFRPYLEARREIKNSDAALAIFEDSAMFYAMMRGFALRLGCQPKKELTVVSCWLAEDVRTFSTANLAASKLCAAGIDKWIVFSENQKDILAEALNIPLSRISAIKFGIDTEFDRTGRPCEAGPDFEQDAYWLSVGRDRSRDYKTLVEAASHLPQNFVVVAPCAEGSIPTNIEWITENIPHTRYRELLAGAFGVVVPTQAPAYPGGQTVILEAMAMGVPVVTATSPAMDEYVMDGLTGCTYEPGNSRSLVAALTKLAGDSTLREAIVSGATQMTEQTNSVAMWKSIRKVVLSQVE